MKDNKPKVIFFTGPVQTGKTTTLYSLVKKRTDIGGFLTPDMDALRYLYDIRQRQYFSFQTHVEGDTIEVGRFSFLRTAFSRMEQIVERDLNSHCAYIIIDELGKLELQKKGLYALAQYLVSRLKEIDKKIIFVVREQLIQEMADLLELQDHGILNKDTFGDWIES